MRKILIPFFSVLCVFAQQPSFSPDAIVLTVGDRQYTRAEFEERLRAQNVDPKELAARLADADILPRLETGMAEAKRRKLDQVPSVRAKLRMYEMAMLNQALFDDILAEVHKDESLARARYESRQSIAEERHLRQILIRHTQAKPAPGKLTPDQALAKAKALRARILGGATFADVAKLESEDTTTKATGGDMNLVRKPLLVPEFGDVAFQLKAGEISEPIKTHEGYHLATVERIVPPAFESVRKSIEFEIARERMRQMPVSGVKLNPDYFGR
jgi:parvulin-like peptidyl-prolyl isomerase